MKNFMQILLLCAVFTAFQGTAGADIQKEAGYISLNTSITKEIEPDTASITFAVENTAETAQKASAENNQISDKIIKSLKAVSSINSDTIKTSNFSVRPVYANTPSGKRVIKNYSAVNSVRVETKDTSKVPKFIDAAMTSGANRTDNLVYSLQNEKKICADLYPSLAKELAKTASELAAAAGAQLDGLKHMNASCNTDTVSNGRFFAKALAVSADGAAAESDFEAPVEAGKVKVRVYLNADFYVK